jgi:hypothetical protein
VIEGREGREGGGHGRLKLLGAVLVEGRAGRASVAWRVV